MKKQIDKIKFKDFEVFGMIDNKKEMELDFITFPKNIKGKNESVNKYFIRNKIEKSEILNAENMIEEFIRNSKKTFFSKAKANKIFLTALLNIVEIHFSLIDMEESRFLAINKNNIILFENGEIVDQMAFFSHDLPVIKLPGKVEFVLMNYKRESLAKENFYSWKNFVEEYLKIKNKT